VRGGLSGDNTSFHDA